SVDFLPQREQARLEQVNQMFLEWVQSLFSQCSSLQPKAGLPQASILVTSMISISRSVESVATMVSNALLNSSRKLSGLG
ncbi:hypothetical protein, partial [Vibrio sp. 10N.261.45.E2]|uniref:hypothetical protein n=1 Tax=Vibrio sp. 10N.261.45.E2 TaxID=1880844 RepID=UPI001F53CF66